MKYMRQGKVGQEDHQDTERKNKCRNLNGNGELRPAL